MKSLRLTSGFTLTEAAATLSIVSIVLAGMVTIASNVLNKWQIDVTTDRMNEIRRATTGNPVIIANESRAAFGYLGDMGNLPVSLQDLWVKGSQAPFTFDTTKKTGGGWNGPYLEMRALEFSDMLALDGWGNPFVYTTSAITDNTFGAIYLGRVQSLGADGYSGGNDDITINLFKSEVQSRVQGYVKDSDGNAVPGVDVTVNYPENGILKTKSATADSNGYYALTDIPYGNRSISIDPKLVLAVDTTVLSGNANQNVTFSVKNFSAADVSIASVTVEFSIVPPAYFATLKLGNTTVYSDTSARIASGETKAVSPTISVTGTGAVQEAIPIRIQSSVTDVADLVIGNIGRGGSLTVEMNGFATLPDGGVDVDVSGVNFEVTFKNSGGATVGVIVATP